LGKGRRDQPKAQINIFVDVALIVEVTMAIMGINPVPTATQQSRLEMTLTTATFMRKFRTVHYQKWFFVHSRQQKFAKSQKSKTFPRK
jgi:hypothetical protein